LYDKTKNLASGYIGTVDCRKAALLEID
jgi:hypothetical protein